MIVTTGPGVVGREIREYLGVVSAQAIMGINTGKDLTAGFRNIVGGRSKAYEGEIAQAVTDVLEELKSSAEGLGADAVVAVDIDAPVGMHRSGQPRGRVPRPRRP
jgi:uncharacterized protein YbjQ (UPF0145 family)